MAYKIPYPTMNWEVDDTGEALALFRQKMELYFDDEDISDKKIQARKICRSIGDEGLKKLNASGLSEDDKKNPEKLWELFENMLRIKVNFRIHRLQFMQYRQKDDKSIDEFVTRARTLTQKCEFTNKELEERILELIIASTPYEQLRRDLLRKEKNFPLKDTLALARTYEAYKVRNEQIAKLGQAHIPPVMLTRCKKCAVNAIAATRHEDVLHTTPHATNVAIVAISLSVAISRGIEGQKKNQVKEESGTTQITRNPGIQDTKNHLKGKSTAYSNSTLKTRVKMKAAVMIHIYKHSTMKLR